MREHRMPALRAIALVVLAAWGTVGHAAGLGPILVQSALGQSLRASVPVLGVDMADLTASCVKVRLAQPDGAPMMAVSAAIARSGEHGSILLSTRQSVNEPAVTLNLQVGCGASVERSYQILLDPVINLARLPQEERQASAVNDAPRHKLREQSIVAAAEEGVALAPARRLAPRKTRHDDPPMPATHHHSASGQTPKASVPLQARKATRSVLKLSGDDEPIDTGATFSSGLKLADTLSESRDTGDAQSAAELKKAYDRFAAVMRDEDPAQSGEKQLKEMQAKLLELEKQTALIREQGERQREADQAALATAKRDATPSGWLVALGGLLLAALAALGWLYRRVRELDREHSAALWERTVLGQSPEPGEWENTLGAGDTFAETENATGVLTEAKPSDWERGVPLDDTLAVDWASQQATMQAASLQMPSMPATDTVGAQSGMPSSAGGSAATGAGSSPRQSRQVQTGAQDANTSGPTLKNASLSSAKPGRAGKADTPAFSMEVEEISDLMQEAEFWMLLNDPERAIDMLQPCLHAAKPVSPVPWIYLLDLYRATGQKQNYQELAVRIKKVFNTNAPAWDKPDREAPARSLRDYPHVVEMIEELWEGDGIIAYLESLLVDEREGERTGFDLSVYREIIHLIGVARDPKTARRREQLSFDDPQPRLISQKVNLSSAKAAKALSPIITEEEADAFDRVMSHQDVARQVSVKPVALKAALVDPDLPSLPVIEPANAGSASALVFAQATAAVVAADTPHDNQAAMPPTFAAPPAAMPRAASPAPDQPTAKEQEAERVADMARKLDLVLAYQEIGEHVGARVLLEEVIQGGTPLQVEKARAMLKKLLKEIDWQ